MLKRFTRYVTQSVAGMIGISVYVLADTFFISVYSGADGLAVLNLILPVYGLIYAIGAMIGIGSATRYAISRAKGKNTDCLGVSLGTAGAGPAIDAIGASGGLFTMSGAGWAMVVLMLIGLPALRKNTAAPTPELPLD